MTHSSTIQLANEDVINQIAKSVITEPVNRWFTVFRQDGAGDTVCAIEFMS